MKKRIIDFPEPTGNLCKKFIAPPFSVLDTRQGYWLKRKKAWRSLGIQGENGRNENFKADVFGRIQESLKFKNLKSLAETSVFDPVLCEVVYTWFMPKRGRVLDPFAGESVKGIIAEYLGKRYTGIELRREQVAENRRQAKRIGVSPMWIVGDSGKLKSIAPKGVRYDLVFTSPPYYDLEVYSSKDSDGSALGTYEEFLGWYKSVFKQATSLLKHDRFLVVKVGEIRDKRTGIYRNFVGDTVATLTELGLAYYNEIILITPAGTLPLRVTQHFNSARKVGKCHQNILVFYKGNPKAIKGAFGNV